MKRIHECLDRLLDLLRLQRDPAAALVGRRIPSGTAV